MARQTLLVLLVSAVHMKPLTVYQADVMEGLGNLSDASIHCCVTSPPYWGLRDYGVAGQIGLEKTPEEYVGKMVEVFMEVKRVLRDDGTLWLNLGDSYCGGGRGWEYCDPNGKQLTNRGTVGVKASEIPNGLKPKDLVGIPWRVAFALRADGWYLRSEIIWAKRNCMPESVTDRPTKSHEQIFLLSKSPHYFYDAEAVKVPASETYSNDSRLESGSTETNYKDGYAEAMAQNPKMPHRVFNGERRNTVNLRDVWHVASQPYPESHFATFPEDLIKPCILAGCPLGGTLLDPFAGSGTTGKVALELGRNAVLIELNPKYIPLINQRCNVTQGLPLA